MNKVLDAQPGRTGAVARAGSSNSNHGLKKWIGQEEIVLGIAVLLFAGFSFSLSGFATMGNLLGLLRNVSVLGILSVGMAVVVIGRGIDLAQTTTMSITAALSIVLMQQNYGVGSALAIGLATALVIGIFHGWLIAYVEIPSLFATLASALFINGLGRWTFMDGQQLAYVPTDANSYLQIGQGVFFGIPMPVIIFGVVSSITAVFLSRTNIGRHIYAKGDNAEAARLSGISTRLLTILEFCICAGIGFIGGVVLSASATSVNTQIVSSGLTFDVILVVVIGGVSLHGGRGRIRGVILATLLVGVVLNGLTILNIHTEFQNIIKGLLLLVAILVDNKLHPRDEETARQGDM